jgi:hypothetical protein
MYTAIGSTYRPEVFTGSILRSTTRGLSLPVTFAGGGVALAEGA